MILSLWLSQLSLSALDPVYITVGILSWFSLFSQSFFYCGVFVLTLLAVAPSLLCHLDFYEELFHLCTMLNLCHVNFNESYYMNAQCNSLFSWSKNAQCNSFGGLLIFHFFSLKNYNIVQTL